MSEKHDHDHEHGHDEGGHEIDRMPNARLFNLLFGLSALTLLACIGVIQLFNMQVDALEHTRADQGSFRIHEYLDEMNKQKSGWGKVEIKELDDKNTTTTRFYMPVASAKKSVLEDPNLLKAMAPPQGWKTADDRAPAAAAPPTKPMPTDGPGMRPQPPTPVPTDGAKPTGDAPPTAPPTGDAPPPSKGDDTPAGGAPDKDAKADDAKAEKPAKPAKPRPPKPAPAKPEPAAEPAADTAG